jgi:hypothetical protein
MVARGCELISERGAQLCYAAYTDIAEWYAPLGLSLWRSYLLAEARLS